MTTTVQHPYADFVHLVEKPARYMGGEYQSVVKDWDAVSCRMALCFPDLYDIGMSHLGTKILYSVVNKADDLCLERAFCPWFDMEEQLRARGLPLVSLESQRPLRDFDIVGFSLQYELTFTNVLTMLDLGGIPLHAEARTLDDPLVIAGGPVATHPEPLAPFIDAFLIGDAEERLPRLMRHYMELKQAGALSRTEILIALAREGGLYCPALYDRELCPRSDLLVVSKPRHAGVPARVQRAFVDDISRYKFPDDSPVAVAEAIFDRMSIEIARGCTEGCRFCQAGMIYRPVRERDPQEVIETLTSAINKGGYDEAALTCLSTADYSCISPLIKQVMGRLRPRKIALGISSLRAYGLDEDLLDEIADVKATGLTFAPEAGTQRMRDVINKNITEDDIFTTCHRVFSRGWSKVKLYFMIGLPTEEDEDVLGVAHMGRQALDIGRQYNRRVEVTVSVSSHVPKPHTPFQWCAMDSLDEIRRKQGMLRDAARREGFKLRCHDPRVSHLEGILARGDYRTGRLIERAWRAGARFDGWDERLDWDVWQTALEAYEREDGVPRRLHLQTLPVDARLPWDHIDVGLEDGFLLKEYKKALKNRLSPPCGKPYQAKVHHTNLEDALADKRKLICYSCGVACDMTRMREERIEFLDKLGAKVRPAPRAAGGERQTALARVKQGLAPRDFAQGKAVHYRLRYAKLGPMAMQGHLDIVRVLPRLFRRAGLSLYYSQGYSPKPVLSFSPALALGMQSLAEYADVSLTEVYDAAALLAALRQRTEPGLELTGARRLGEGEKALSRAIDAIDIAVVLRQGPADLEVRCAAALAAAALPVEVRRKDETRMLDLRPLLLELRPGSSDEFAALTGHAPGLPAVTLRLRVTNVLTPRPGEIAQALFGVTVRPLDIVRTGCWTLDATGAVCDPLGDGASLASHWPAEQPTLAHART